MTALCIVWKQLEVFSNLGLKTSDIGNWWFGREETALSRPTVNYLKG